MKRVVYLRADADREIGYGHFMRTLALGEMLSDQFDCRFVTKTPSSFQRGCLEGVCDLIELPDDETRFSLFVEMVKDGDIVVLDNYFFDADYEIEIRKKGAKVVLIDNLHSRHIYADVVLGFAMGLKEKLYSVEAYTKLYLGPAYSLIRRPFVEQLSYCHPLIKDTNKLNIVVSFGGSDKEGIAATITNYLKDLDNVQKITLIGNNLEGLLPSKKVKVKSHLAASEMRDEFVENDIAILPASTTLFEALACGIPVLVGYYVDNQLFSYTHAIEEKGIIGCGNLADPINQQKLIRLVDKGVIGTNYTTPSIIPINLKENIINIFKSL